MQICNRVEEHKVLCTKSGLSRVLDKILAEHGGNGSPEATPSSSASLAWIPESYVLPAKGADKKLYEQFRCAYERHVAGGTGSTWIVKPTSLNRGNGIEVFNKHEDIMTHLKSGDRTGERCGEVWGGWSAVRWVGVGWGGVFTQPRQGNDNAWWGVVLREPVVREWAAVSYLNWTSYHRG